MQIMTAIDPIPIMPALVARFTNTEAPAGLVALSRKTPIAGSPESAMGSALPSEPLLWRTYGPDGRLVQLRAGTSFLAHV